MFKILLFLEWRVVMWLFFFFPKAFRCLCVWSGRLCMNTVFFTRVHFSNSIWCHDEWLWDMSSCCDFWNVSSLTPPPSMFYPFLYFCNIEVTQDPACSPVSASFCWFQRGQLIIANDSRVERHQEDLVDSLTFTLQLFPFYNKQHQ